MSYKSEDGLFKTIEEMAQKIQQEEEKVLASEWAVGVRDRGLGHSSYAILCNDKPISPDMPLTFVEHIVHLHNKSLEVNDEVGG